MHLSDKQVSQLLDNLGQINAECEQVLKEGLDKPIANALYLSYKELKSFLNELEILNPELQEKINRLPTLQEPNSLIENIMYLNMVALGIISPYLFFILITFTAPVSIPFIIIIKLWYDKQKKKVREIASLVSSIKFILEYPRFFEVENK